MSELTFHYYMQLTQQESEQTFRLAMETAGYFAFYTFIEDFRGGLKSYSDEDKQLYRLKLDRASALFPTPEQFSPSWNTIWEQFNIIFVAKNEALSAISPSLRDGEWQILIDNPYSHQQVVCYPSLVFTEAAYMYGYFQRDLKPHECLRMQKVTELLTVNGRKEASLFPDT
ncbi:hypothetical protein [Cohnella abietis]|uniref:Uncharacterized protein n=1 Tax=Cohnella abietis TaxID=2507935 RepID=A0A3T1D6J6_9BACL|nr:hypothetical protein [Cohnella abietis]BBI33707.1 hypothetical protein KCTCHS21_31060 [Cohnella abietis]